MLEENPAVLTCAEVARELRVAAKTVRAAIRRGEIPAFRIGGALRVRRADLPSVKVAHSA